MSFKIKAIRRSVRSDNVYDIETETHDYILSNGLISHNTMEMYSKDVMGGGTAVVYMPNQSFIITRSQDKDASGKLNGYNFTINIEKSRYVREKSKLAFNVNFEEGISKWSGLYDLATESGFIQKSGGWCQIVDFETGEISPNKIRQKDIGSEFYKALLVNDKFKKFVKDTYALAEVDMISEDNVSVELE